MRRLPAIAALVGALVGCGESPPPPGDEPADEPRAATLAPDPIVGPSPPPPTLPEALRPAVALIERGRFAEAREIAEAYLRAHAGDAPALFVKGLTFHRARNYAAAEPLFVRALSADPSYHVVHHFLGYCRFHLGNDLPGARAAFEAHLRSMPGESDSHFGLGLVELAEGRLDEAEARFDRAIELIKGMEESDPARYRTRRLDLAKCYGRLGDIAFARVDYERARALMHDAIAIDPNQYATYYALSQVERRLGDADEADRLFRLYEQMAAARHRRPRGGSDP